MINRLFTLILAFFATIVGLYPFIYFVVDRKFGLLQSKSEAVLTNTFWNVAFYTHITLGGVALLIGWIQFNKNWRDRHLNLHRKIGKTYVVVALVSALAGINIAFYASGGFVSAVGFICLGLVWFTATWRAYTHIRNGRVEEHKKMMIYSYAACLAAVTLRIYLPLLIMLFGDFNIAYPIVAWLCWVPNVIVASFIIRKLDYRNKKIADNTLVVSALMQEYHNSFRSR